MVKRDLPLWKVRIIQDGFMKKYIHVRYLISHHGLLTFTIMEYQGNTRWVYQYTHSCFVNFHHGLLTFTIIECQDNTAWFYQYTHSCFVTFHHGLLTFAIIECQDNTAWVYGQEKHIFAYIPSWFTAASILPLSR